MHLPESMSRRNGRRISRSTNQTSRLGKEYASLSGSTIRADRESGPSSAPRVRLRECRSPLSHIEGPSYHGDSTHPRPRKRIGSAWGFPPHRRSQVRRDRCIGGMFPSLCHRTSPSDTCIVCRGGRSGLTRRDARGFLSAETKAGCGRRVAWCTGSP